MTSYVAVSFLISSSSTGWSSGEMVSQQSQAFASADCPPDSTATSISERLVGARHVLCVGLHVQCAAATLIHIVVIVMLPVFVSSFHCCWCKPQCGVCHGMVLLVLLVNRAGFLYLPVFVV